jgi:hypothetical protein
MDAKQFLAEALHLSDEERAAVAAELIQSLEHGDDPDAEGGWSASGGFGVPCPEARDDPDRSHRNRP